ncbi:Putative ParB-like nuclease [Paraburkholderia atlantica]|uniref:ParB-like nuclease n=1 Tax=Paraburkholderia atlantica TaxID=2654982 RepID=D5WM41_PARAM|nr:ParB/Srx family N-terminal domain-containing protein [Paraburkholderia atlantica]ADG20287.1 Putative ParB-like nuclease [Paraburkholderia atlantica]
MLVRKCVSTNFSIMMYLHVNELRPTQMTIGARYVSAKALLTDRHSNDTNAFMERHAVRVALGPGHSFFVVDHHHWACAWRAMGIDSVPVTVVADFAACDSDAFWERMRQRHWLHPFDDRGVRRAIGEMPMWLSAMMDDPYQSLAAFARRAGAYRKPKRAYESFLWASFFRAHVPIHDTSEAAFALALTQAVRFARAREAASLPGFVGNR